MSEALVHCDFCGLDTANPVGHFILCASGAARRLKGERDEAERLLERLLERYVEERVGNGEPPVVRDVRVYLQQKEKRDASAE